jgi:DNA-binding IclR family transcriptional regulator
MLMEMMNEPRCAEVAARLLGRDVAETKRLLDGMVSVGVLEVCPRGYSPTIATRLYCQSLLQGGR